MYEKNLNISNSCASTRSPKRLKQILLPNSQSSFLLKPLHQLLLLIQQLSLLFNLDLSLLFNLVLSLLLNLSLSLLLHLVLSLLLLLDLALQIYLDVMIYLILLLRV